ncbi:MAG: HEAT repeat domain-containing protein [Gemmataceae bacterium]
MAVVTSCPNCDFPTNLPDQFRGDRVRCLNCNTVFPAAILRKPANPPPLVGSPPKRPAASGGLPVARLIPEESSSKRGQAGSPPEPDRDIPLEVELVPIAQKLPLAEEADHFSDAPPRRNMPIILVAAGAACFISLLALMAFLAWGLPALTGNRDGAAEKQKVVDGKSSETARENDEEPEVKKDSNSLSFKDPEATKKAEPRIVPLPNPRPGVAKNRSDSEWADARVSAVQLGGVRVQVASLRADEGQFRIRLLLESVGTTEAVGFQGWGTEAANRPHLIDTAGHSIEGGSGLEKAPGELAPGQSLGDEIWFTMPRDIGKYLRLELPAVTLGGRGQLRFELAREMLVLEAPQLLGVDKATADLRSLLKNDDKATRRAAARAFAELGPGAAAAVTDFVEATKDPDPQTRLAVINALGKIGQAAKQAKPAVVAALGDDHEEVCQAAGRVLEALGPPTKEDVTALKAALSSPKPAIRLFAATSLNNLGADAILAVTELAKSTHDKDKNVRLNALAALEKIGRGARSAIPSLSASSLDIDSDVRRATAKALKAIDPKAVVSVYKQALLSDRDDIRRDAASALGQIGAEAKEASRELNVLLTDKNPDVRVKAAEAIWKIERRVFASVQVLVEVLQDGPDEARRDAASVLVQINALPVMTIPAWTNALKDKDVEVRRISVQALGQFAEKAEGVIPNLMEAMKEPALRDTAAEALAAIGKPAIPALIQAVNGFQAQQRLGAVKALGKIGPDAREVLESLNNLYYRSKKEKNAELEEEVDKTIQTLRKAGTEKKK